MKYNLVFSNDNAKVDFFSTNVVEPTVEDLIKPNTYILSYTLNDKKLTSKFVDAFVGTQNHNLAADNKITYNYNYYFNANERYFLLAKREMNRVIDELNTINLFQLDTALKLDLDSLDPEYDKLNELHFRFESELVNLTIEYSAGGRVWYLLEKINNLVHFLERGSNGSMNEINYFFLSLRPKSNMDYWYKLEDIDYDSFSLFEPGDLIADYSTVGKDLFAAVASNDMELIRRGELKQQQYITGYAFMPHNYHQPNVDLDQYNRWLTENGVSDYINIYEKQYTPGRHVLGKSDKKFNSAQDFYNQVLDKTPYCVGAYISDDSGSIIYTETQK